MKRRPPSNMRGPATSDMSLAAHESLEGLDEALGAGEQRVLVLLLVPVVWQDQGGEADRPHRHTDRTGLLRVDVAQVVEPERDIVTRREAVEDQVGRTHHRGVELLLEDEELELRGGVRVDLEVLGVSDDRRHSLDGADESVLLDQGQDGVERVDESLPALVEGAHAGIGEQHRVGHAFSLLSNVQSPCGAWTIG